MPRNKPIETLLELHRVDTEVEKLNSQKELLPVSLRRIRTRLDRQRESIAERKERIKALRAEGHSQELLLRSAEAEAEKLQKQLLTIRTNREFAALQHEIAAKQADSSRMEDQALASMANIEALEAEVRELGQSIAQIQREHDQEAEAIDKELKSLDRRVRQLQASREDIAAGVDPELLGEYQRIASRKGASALAPVVGETCQGCFMQLPPQLSHTLKSGRKVVRCSNCSRLLYLP